MMQQWLICTTASAWMMRSNRLPLGSVSLLMDSAVEDEANFAGALIGKMHDVEVPKSVRFSTKAME